METKILNEDYLERAKDILLSDGVIGFPTDTVYGLACSAFSEKAIEKIYTLKGRESTKALIVMVPQNYNLELLVKNISNDAKKLMKEFWPGALTIIFLSQNIIPKNATGGLDTIGVRIPNSKIAIDLLNYVNIPLCTTSANISGQKSPISANEVLSYFKDKLELIIDGGVCDKQIPSTIVDISKGDIRLLRLGSITEQDINICLKNNIKK